MSFDELLAKLRENAEDTPDTIYDDLASEYQKIFEGSQESIKQRDEQLTATQQEIARLKAMNFDLITSAAAVDNDPEPDDDEDRDEESGGIDSLFSSNEG